MGIQIEALFTSALGFSAPWRVEKVELDTAHRRIDFELACDAKRLSCPSCGLSDQCIHNHQMRDWQYLDFFQYGAWLHAAVPRITCSGCGKTTQVPVPWARECNGFTALFEALALSLCQELPVRQAAALLRCVDKQLWRRIEHYVVAARKLQDMSEVKVIGINGTSLRNSQNYITVVHDFEKKRLLFACEGRDHQTVVDFCSDLKAHGSEPQQIQHICQDMSAAFVKGVTQVLPKAHISFDRFHIVAMATKAMDEVRQEETRTQPKAIKQAFGGNDRHLLKSLSWGMRRNPDGWSTKQLYAMRWLQHSSLKSARAWRLKMALRTVYANAVQHNKEAQAKAELVKLVELGHPLSLGAVQKTRQDIKATLGRCGARHA